MTLPEIRLDPVQAHGAGVELAHAGEAVSAVRTGVGERLAAAGAARPWGGDSIGEKFQQNYVENAATILSALGDVGTYVEVLGAQVTHAVAATMQADRAAAQRVTGI